jgi:hypothetical protein
MYIWDNLRNSKESRYMSSLQVTDEQTKDFTEEDLRSELPVVLAACCSCAILARPASTTRLDCREPSMVMVLEYVSRSLEVLWVACSGGTGNSCGCCLRLYLPELSEEDIHLTKPCLPCLHHLIAVGTDSRTFYGRWGLQILWGKYTKQNSL